MTERAQTRNAERTRRAILDAATQAILNRGAAVTLAEIATVAGVSKSVLIHHFGNRDQLLVAVAAIMILTAVWALLTLRGAAADKDLATEHEPDLH